MKIMEKFKETYWHKMEPNVPRRQDWEALVQLGKDIMPKVKIEFVNRWIFRVEMEKLFGRYKIPTRSGWGMEWGMPSLADSENSSREESWHSATAVVRSGRRRRSTAGRRRSRQVQTQTFKQGVSNGGRSRTRPAESQPQVTCTFRLKE